MESSDQPQAPGEGTPAPPPPPAPAVAADDEKASGGMRALGALLALALAFAAAVMIVAMVDIADTEVCTDLQESGAPVAADTECFGEATVNLATGEIIEASGSGTQKTISLVLGFPSGVIAAIAALVALFFAATGRHGRLLLQLTAAAVVLGGLSILIGSL
jgi:hypothetical protein